ncbi:hypothetical protein TSAR_001979 [Trichomalopsis sarcophagae]|uniref:Uncharacterized protein n=1 Tax=Trichomalopsis sarcophagae TaxID=543379 RepID=A0A232EF55_9HYME|nr:hypothetical protein TSAR_001979 [Trichomalopsis sarcophagae]
MAVQFWGPGVEEVPEIEDDDGYASEVGSVGEVGKEVGVDGLNPFYPCHGMAGSSIYVDGRCVICRQPSASPAAMHVKRTDTGVQISYRVLSAEDEPSPGGWFLCHQEDWDAPEESCLVCEQSLRGVRMSGFPCLAWDEVPKQGLFLNLLF